MKKPVAEVNIKIFGENGHYKANTFVSIDSDDVKATLATLEALGDLSGKIINEKSKELVKNIFKGIAPDDELEKIITDIEEKEVKPYYEDDYQSLDEVDTVDLLEMKEGALNDLNESERTIHRINQILASRAIYATQLELF